MEAIVHTDILDQAAALADAERESGVAAIRAAASRIEVGAPGDCDFCGEWTGRLVHGACAPCRDARHLP
jgi:hypothetical protein